MEQIEDVQAGAGANRCPACGAEFVCGMNAGLTACWCASLPPLLAVPDAHVGQCYCPDCLRQKLAEAGQA